MTVALAGRAPATFEIKSANLPLVALLLKSGDLGALAADLAARFADVPDFFDNDPLVIDLSPLKGDAPVDFGALIELLRGYRVRPVAVRGGAPQQMAAAVQAGLAAAPEAVVGNGGRTTMDWIAGQARNDKAFDTPPRDDKAFDAPPRNDKVFDAPPRNEMAPRKDTAGAPSSALIVEKPLRSGQQVYARGRDLIVLSIVNAGAEVIADGHIHVYAPLRGRAIAGARGNTEARILTLCLEPELISIAGVYRTSEVPLPAGVQSKPTQVRLVGGVEGKLVMEALK